MAPPSPPSRPSPAITVEDDGRTTKRVPGGRADAALLARAGPEPQPGVGGEGRQPFARAAHRHRRVRERMARQARGTRPRRRGRSRLDAPAAGLGDVADLGPGTVAVPGARAGQPGPPARARQRTPTPPAAAVAAPRNRPRPATTVAVTAGVALVTTLVAGPATGALVGGLTLAALLVPRARVLVTLGAVGALAAAGLYTAALQYIAALPLGVRVAHVLPRLAQPRLGGRRVPRGRRRRRAGTRAGRTPDARWRSRPGVT